MPAFTFTADSVTDQLTIVGHGQVTGNGPAAVRNIGGALPVGLASVTDLWLIRVDNDHLKLAASSADALAGTAINLTSNGTGTNIFEIGLPYRVPRTAVKGSQIEPEDDNATWQSLVALYGLLTAQAQSIWASVQLAVSLTVNGLITAAAGLTVGPNQHVRLSGTGEVKHGDRECSVPGSAFIPQTNSTVGTPGFGGLVWSFGTPPNDRISAPIGLQVGDRIKSITWHFDKNSNASAMVMTLETRNGPTTTTRDTLSDASSGANQVSVTRSAINYTLVSGDAAQLTVQAGSNVHQFSHAVIVYDRPQ
jgi:hypothetical protein